MCMMHKAFHAMFESKKRRFYWCINIDTEVHCDILKIIESLDSDVNESIKAVI